MDQGGARIPTVQPARLGEGARRVGPRGSRTLGQRTATGPMPVWISRSGKCPWRTIRRRPAESVRCAYASTKPATSASTACPSKRRAPRRKTSVSGSSSNDPGWRSWTTVSSLMVYPSFVENGDSNRKAGVLQQTYYRWRKKYAGLMPSEVRRLKQLEEENARLKRMVADLSLDKRYAARRDPPKALRPAKGRELVDYVRGVWQVRIRRACGVLQIRRST